MPSLRLSAISVKLGTKITELGTGSHNLGELNKPCPVDVFGVGILSCGVLGFEVQVIVFRIQGSSCSV
jgi:hypothetical protein